MKFTSGATGSVVAHLQVDATGATNQLVGSAIEFDAANGKLTDLSAASSTADAIDVTGSGVTVGPAVTVTTTTPYESTGVNATGAAVMLTGVTSTASIGAKISSGGIVVDSSFHSAVIGLQISAGTTVRRVHAFAGTPQTVGTGIEAAGGGLVTDSLAVSVSGYAIRAFPGSPLRLANVTAIASGTGSVGVEATGSISAGQPVGTIIAENVIARGSAADLNTNVFACLIQPCPNGVIQIGYSNFVSTTGPIDTSQGHNQSSDPLFASATDFHLQTGSPAIGAGISDAYTGTTDLDGKPRPLVGEPGPSLGAYEPPTHRLTITIAGIGHGTVTVGGLSCSSTCSTPVAAGAALSLAAAPTGNSTFTGWSGAGCSGTSSCLVTLNADTTVTATFAPPRYILTVTLRGSGAGTVTAPGLSCRKLKCTASYPAGTTVKLSQKPSAGSTFSRWSGACAHRGACTVTMKSNLSVGATFTTIDNRFTVTHIRARSNGTVTFDLTVPGPGRADVFETAPNRDFAAGDGPLHPGPHRFAFARLRVALARAGTYHETVAPDALGKRPRRHPVRINLWVTYTPAGGAPRVDGILGLKL